MKAMLSLNERSHYWKNAQMVSAFFIIAAASFYFNIFPYLLKLSGLHVKSGYYNTELIADIKGHVFYFSFFANALFFLVLLISCYIFFFKKLPSLPPFDNFKLPVSFKVILLIASLIASLEYQELSRDEIKSSSNFHVEVLFITTLTLLSHELLITNKKKIIIVNLIFIGFVAFTLFEREVILYALLPLILRKGMRKNNLLYVAIIFTFLASLFLIYKPLLNALKGEDSISANSIVAEQSLAYQLGVDSIHKLSLEISYFGNDHPDYDNITLLAPYQLLRTIDPERTTNGRLATNYYTNNNTGTGFSAVLEGVLNFYYLGLIIYPLFLGFIFYLGSKCVGSVFLLPYLIFMVKISRADFWPLFISTILIPISFIYILKRLSNYNIQVRHK